MIEAVLFDVDGTLLDSVDAHAESWRLTLKEFGHDVPFEKVRSQIGKGGDQLMPSLLPKEEVEKRGKEIEKRRQELFRQDFLAKVHPFPCVRELLSRVRESGLKLGLASSANSEELEIYIDCLNIRDLIHASTTSDDAERSKPHPDLVHAALERIGADANRTVMVGDSPYDAEAATKAGCRCIGVLCGGFSREVLESAGVIAIFNDPANLLHRYEDSPLAE